MSTSAFALALLGLDGVGRVTAGRLLEHFASYDDLRRYPREQVLTRVKGAPRAADLVARLFDAAYMHGALERAGANVHALSKKGVHVLTARDADWPAGLGDLSRSDRPAVLFAYGPRAAFEAPAVAFFAEPPLSDTAFEQAQSLVRHLLPRGVRPATGTHHGFDVVVHKLASAGETKRPSILVAHCGLGRLPPPMRPVATQVVRSGGMLLSPFAMEHGPFDHDDRERALVLAALAAACVFVEPTPDSSAWHAMTWALGAHRPVFGIPAAETDLPDRVHRLQTPVDFDWVLAATRL